LLAGGFSRPDVAASYEIGGYGDAGFDDTILAESLGPGSHTLKFRVLSADATAYFGAREQLRLVVKGKES